MHRIVNKKARHDYHILETVEAGVVLSGQEVKSIRGGRVDMGDAFARIQNGQVYLKNVYIYPYMNQVIKDYDPKHDRKLLLHKNQISSLIGKVSKSAVTLIPLSLYEKHNFIKVEIALAASKKKFDKRKAIKAKDEQRRLSQELKNF